MKKLAREIKKLRKEIRRAVDFNIKQIEKIDLEKTTEARKCNEILDETLSIASFPKTYKNEIKDVLKELNTSLGRNTAYNTFVLDSEKKPK